MQAVSGGVVLPRRSGGGVFLPLRERCNLGGGQHSSGPLHLPGGVHGERVGRVGLHGLHCGALQELDGHRCDFQLGMQPPSIQNDSGGCVEPLCLVTGSLFCCSCLATVSEGCAGLPSQGRFRFLCLKYPCTREVIPCGQSKVPHGRREMAH